MGFHQVILPTQSSGDVSRHLVVHIWGEKAEYDTSTTESNGGKEDCSVRICRGILICRGGGGEDVRCDSFDRCKRSRCADSESN